MKKAFFVNIALASILLTSTLLLSVTTSTRGNNSEYDPRADVNNDGVIDVSDLILIAHSLGASGDPNMTSSKFDYEVLYLGRVNCTGNAYFNFWGYVGGYSRVSIFAVPTTEIRIITGEPDYTLTISLAGLLWSLNNEFPSHPNVGLIAENVLPWQLRLKSWSDDGFWQSAPASPMIFETKAPYFNIEFSTSTDYPQPNSVWAVVDFYAYLRNE